MRLSRTSGISSAMEALIVPLLFEVQLGACAHCGEPMEQAQIHHKRYGLDITLYDLELIHGQCHANTHGSRAIRGKERELAKVSQV